MKKEQTQCSETSAYNIQTPGEHLKERIKKDNTYYVMILITNPAQTNTALYTALSHPTGFSILTPSQKVKFTCTPQCPHALKQKNDGRVREWDK
jgi:hypothetical protein